MKVTDLTTDQLVELWREEGQLIDNEGNVLLDVDIIEESDWRDDGKFSTMNVVVKDEDGKHYMFEIIRSGSYFTHYDFECYDDAVEVYKILRTITKEEWMAV